MCTIYSPQINLLFSIELPILLNSAKYDINNEECMQKKNNKLTYLLNNCYILQILSISKNKWTLTKKLFFNIISIWLVSVQCRSLLSCTGNYRVVRYIEFFCLFLIRYLS